MRKVTLTLTIIMVLVFSVSLAMAQDQTKTSEVLRLELKVLEAQAETKANELNRFLLQVEFLRLKIPAVQAELTELNAQIRKKVSEITDVEKPATPEPKKE